MKRTIGPVTSTIGAAAAAIVIVVAILSSFGIHVESEVQTALTMLVVYAAGWAVSPEKALERAITELYLGEYDANAGE